MEGGHTSVPPTATTPLLTAAIGCRLHEGQSHVELEWTVGPIPFEDGLGREVVLQVSLRGCMSPAGGSCRCLLPPPKILPHSCCAAPDATG